MVTYPNSWREVKLLDCVELVQGLTYKPENVSNFGTLVLRSSNIQDGHLDLSDNVFVDIDVQQKMMIQEGDILVCVRNGSAALIGKSCVLEALPKTTFGAFMSVLRGDSTGYIAKIFESDAVQKQVRDRTSATINQITKKDFGSILIPLPPKEEQIAIADALSQFDELIANLDELIEKKRNIREGIRSDLVCGASWLDNSKVEFTTLPLASIAQYIREAALCPKCLYISTENMLQCFGGIEPYSGHDEVTGHSYKKGDVLLGNIRPYLKKAWLADHDGCCSPDVLVIRPSVDINSHILYYCLANEVFIDYVMSGGTKGTKMPRGDKKYIMQYQIAIPVNRSDQDEIANSIASFDAEIAALEEERDKMIQIRDGAMDDLLTGRVRLAFEGDNNA